MNIAILFSLQIENLHGHQMAPQIIPGYYNSEYPTSYNYQWNASITFPNQSVSYRPLAFCQSRYLMETG